MDRRAWLGARRAAVEEDFTRGASTYEDTDTPITPTHGRFVGLLLETMPPGGTVLDAPCGTGKYFGIVEAAGRQVVGLDQSAGMLEQARRKGVAIRLEKTGLQELAFDGAFDAVMSVDAMENVPPEDWPLVLANFRRALRPGGHLYFTVEEIDEPIIDRAFAEGSALGLPLVRGERIDEGAAGYHFYPGRERVNRWLDEAGFDAVEEGHNQGHGYGYHHRLVRSRS
jgi:ubiquinone/menaquinone biosynthesis C-methylase UbiE